MRWSDGHPVTTRDVEFAFYDFMLHPIIHPTPSTWLRSGGRPANDLMDLEIIDRYTFSLTSSEPYGGFITWLAFSNYTNLLQPYHYLRDFHIDYADHDTLMGMVTDHGFTEAEWHTFFQYHRVDGWHSGRTSQMVGGTPTLGPWIQVQNGDLRFYERNPFYWKIDPDGRQLPYIDTVQSQFVTDISAASIRILAGEIDHAYEWVPLNQVALFAEHAEAGGYRLLTNTLLHRTDADILINQTHEDPAWRQVAQDVRFRRALSLAINREEMLEAVYFGFARISDIQDPTHDLALANELLDEMGMEFGPDGFRTAPDGSPLFIDFLYSAVMAQYAATAQIANESFRDLGLNINLRQADSAMVDTTVDANESQLTVAFQHGPVTAMFDDWRFNAWGRLWNLYWTTNGAQGEPMPPAVRQFYEDVFSIRSVHPSEIPSIRARLRQSIAENYWSIIPVEDVVQISLINNDLRNVPDAGFMISACWNADGWWFDR
jgi:peptide/nickel transport system substrate-binding protein